MMVKATLMIKKILTKLMDQFIDDTNEKLIYQLNTLKEEFEKFKENVVFFMLDMIRVYNVEKSIGDRGVAIMVEATKTNSITERVSNTDLINYLKSKVRNKDTKATGLDSSYGIQNNKIKKRRQNHYE